MSISWKGEKVRTISLYDTTLRETSSLEFRSILALAIPKEKALLVQQSAASDGSCRGAKVYRVFIEIGRVHKAFYRLLNYVHSYGAEINKLAMVEILYTLISSKCSLEMD